MEKKTTKINKVKNWLLSGKAISQRDAIEYFDYYRLSDAIYKLKKRGMDIETKIIHENGIQYARYKLA